MGGQTRTRRRGGGSTWVREEERERGGGSEWGVEGDRKERKGKEEDEHHQDLSRRERERKAESVNGNGGKEWARKEESRLTHPSSQLDLRR